MLLSSAHQGAENAGFARYLLGFVLAVLILGSCSNPPERVPVAQPDPTETGDTAESNVVTPPPTAVATVEPTIDDQVSTQAIASLTTLKPGEQVIDQSGNLVTVHGLRRFPAALDGAGAFDLFADTEVLVSSTNELVMLDVAMCTAGEFSEEPAGSVEFLAAPDANAVLDEAANLFTTHALIAPGFAFPEPGSCSRGWVPVDLTDADADDPVGRYVLAVAGGAGAGLDKHVYQWPVDSAEGEAASGFERGHVVTFNDGPLTGTTVTFGGWAELIDAEAPAGTRLVGTKLTVCPATEDWPEFGISVDEWNLFGPVDPADRLGADPFAPISGSCFDDWAEFAVPFGAAPTGFFVSDGIDPVNGFAQWTFAGAAILGPT